MPITFFQIALPWDVLVLQGEELPNLTTLHEIDGVRSVDVVIVPPYRSKREGRESTFGDGDLMNPADPQPVDPDTTIGGKQVVRCDTIAVEFHSEHEFDRTIGQGSPEALTVAACEVC